MIKTGIYGGSFNPVHHGHLRLARTLLREAGLDEVWFMVSPQNPLKQQSELLDDDKRLELVRLALQGEPGLVACDYEFHLPRPSYTYDTLSAMRRDFPDRSFTLLIGADNWADFQHWYKHDAILAEYPIMVYPRKGSPIDETTLPPRVRLLQTPLINISSTDIRCRIRAGQSIARLVPQAVNDLIEREQLYAALR